MGERIIVGVPQMGGRVTKESGVHSGQAGSSTVGVVFSPTQF